MVIRRVTYRKKNTYNTKGNKIKVLRTPGGKLTIKYRKKRVSGLTCADTGENLNGIPHMRSYKAKSLSKNQRTVARPYGGVLCSSALRDRIRRAFLIEELQIIKSMTKIGKDEKKKKASKKGKKSAKPKAKGPAKKGAAPKK